MSGPPDPWGLADRLDLALREIAALRAELQGLRSTATTTAVDPYIDAGAAAELAGRSRPAFKRLRQRHPEIDARSVGDGKGRRWPRSVILEMVRAGGLRTVGGR